MAAVELLEQETSHQVSPALHHPSGPPPPPLAERVRGPGGGAGGARTVAAADAEMEVRTRVKTMMTTAMAIVAVGSSLILTRALESSRPPRKRRARTSQCPPIPK
eukprot:5326866-Alexandrium_andersonii.AAC.1